MHAGRIDVKFKKRPDGRYSAQIYIGKDENGRNKYKNVCAKSKTELKVKETEVRIQLSRGIDILSQRDSFSQWADDWLRIRECDGITLRQMGNYTHAVKAWKEIFEDRTIDIPKKAVDDMKKMPRNRA